MPERITQPSPEREAANNRANLLYIVEVLNAGINNPEVVAAVEQSATAASAAHLPVNPWLYLEWNRALLHETSELLESLQVLLAPDTNPHNATPDMPTSFTLQWDDFVIAAHRNHHERPAGRVTTTALECRRLTTTAAGIKLIHAVSPQPADPACGAIERRHFSINHGEHLNTETRDFGVDVVLRTPSGVRLGGRELSGPWDTSPMHHPKAGYITGIIQQTTNELEWFSRQLYETETIEW